MTGPMAASENSMASIGRPRKPTLPMAAHCEFADAARVFHTVLVAGGPGLPDRSADADRDALAAFRNALKPGGLLCLTVPGGVGATRKIKDSTGRWAAYLEYGPETWSALTSLPGFELVSQVGVAEGPDGWQTCEPFEDVYQATVGDNGLPRGCIMSVLKAV